MRSLKPFAILVWIAVLLIIGSLIYFNMEGVKIAGAKEPFYKNFHWVAGQEHYRIVEENGYERYRAYFPYGEDGKMGSSTTIVDGEVKGVGYACWNNCSLLYKNVYGRVTPKEMGESPTSDERLETWSFAGENHIEVEEPEDEKDIKIKEQELKIKKLETNMASLVEEAVREAVAKVLSNL